MYDTFFKFTQIAMKIEAFGIKFYESVAEGVTDEKVKKILLFLADQERAHVETFLKISEEYHDLDNSEKMGEFIDLKISGLIESFKNAVRRALDMKGGAMTVADSLNQAILLESKSIELYESIMDLLHDKHKLVLLRILKEEKKHRQMLEDVKTIKKL